MVEKMPFTLRERSRLTCRRIGSSASLTLYAVLLMVFTWLGPFGTYGKLALPMLFLYWWLSLTLSWASWVATNLLLGYAYCFGDKPPWREIVFTSLAASPPIVMVNQGLLWLFLDKPVRLESLVVNLFYSLMMALVLASVSYLVIVGLHKSRLREARAETVSAEEKVHPLIRKLLPAGDRGLVQLIAAEDHYIRILTTDNEVLVHFKFQDALALMPEELGLRVHRSYWVAKAAVTDATRREGKHALTLINGKTVPVSRRYGAAATKFFDF